MPTPTDETGPEPAPSTREARRRAPVAAAIFELDRTLIGDASGPVFARHLRGTGVEHSSLAGAGLLASRVQLLNEPPLTEQIARIAARATAGWSTAAVDAAARAAARELEGMMPPYAPGVIDEHRAAGRLLVLATAAPEPLVTAFAEKLGFDAVVATRWATDGDTYTGAIEGPLVAGRAKLDAVREWASDAGVDLAASWAYGNSYHDAPLLDAVGHATAVNADVRLVTLARLKGWPIRHFDLPDGVLKIAGRELQDWTRPLQRIDLLPNLRLDVAGVEKIPRNGPVIAVFNHRSYLDGPIVATVLARSGRTFRFLGKKEVFDVPVVGFFSRMAGGIRVNRASGSNEPLEHAIRALRAGDAVSLAPQGTIPRGPAFFEPELKGRWGAARLAHATRAPVIPVGLWGTEHVWPRNRRVPHLSLTNAPSVRVRVGDPVELGYRSLDADTERIMAAIVDQLPDEARERVTPTAEQLAATYPAGYRGDPEAEAVRRPGTDT